MISISVEEAQAILSELIANPHPGDEVVITRDELPVARLRCEQPAGQEPRQPGSAKGMLAISSDDDEHLKDFAEYMP